MDKNDYSIKLKEKLNNLVPREKNSGRVFLSARINNKVKKMSNLNENDIEGQIKYFILNTSLFFIKNDGFINEKYFSLIDDSIYKLFYDLLLSPSEREWENFWKGLRNLEYGAGNIILICEKICNEFKVGALDLFFIIILNENRERLNKLLKKTYNLNLVERYENILKKLSIFTKIKNNYKVDSKEVLNYFLDAVNKKQDMEEEDIKKENSKEDRIEEKKNQIKKSNKEKNIEKESNNIQSSQFQFEQENISTEGEKYIEKNENKFLNYLNEMKQFYENLKYKTPVLNYLIEKNGKLCLDYFQYTKNEDSLVDHLFENLNKLIIDLTISFDKEKYGYFCFYDNLKEKYIESLYSIIDLNLLHEKITSDKNFPKDDFLSPDFNLSKNAFKSRALSFEYFINNNILIHKFKVKERPRVIYPFRSKEELDKSIPPTKEKNLIEVDGVVFEEKEIELNFEKNCFIIDNLYKISEFDDKKEKKIEPYKEEKIINLKSNTLCIIEIKNKFPPNDKVEKQNIENSTQEKQPINFYNMVKQLIKKGRIFKEMYDQQKAKIEHLRFILFYNVIQKGNYYEELKKAVQDSFADKKDNLYKILEFQCIYIKSSYLAGTEYNSSEEISRLNKKIENINKNINEKIKEMEKQNEQKLKEKIEEKINEQKKEMEKQNEQKLNEKIKEMEKQNEEKLKEKIKEIEKKYKEKIENNRKSKKEFIGGLSNKFKELSELLNEFFEVEDI